MIAAFTLARTAFALYSVHEATGVLGLDETVSALLRIAPKLAIRARGHDAALLDQMVANARALAPEDTGRLLNGIEGVTFDDYCEFRASAQKQTDSADYARFVEFGTAGSASRAPITAQDMFNGASRPRNRKSYRTHPGTAAQPFFYPAAREVLAERPEQFDAMIEDVARTEGF